uniref:Phosphatidylcholine transfer protein n=1 Tax=Otus sunia TaxID=257818 RepID=A0A8C8EDV7_9STRI
MVCAPPNFLQLFSLLLSTSLSCVTFPLPILFPQQSGLYEYKLFGGLADCTPKLCVDVYMDLNFRKQWDQYVEGNSRKTGLFLCIWFLNNPYVYIRECREMDVDGRKIWVVLAQSVSVPQCPEKPGIIRVKSYKQSLAIESDGKTGSKGKWSRRYDHESYRQRMYVLARCTKRKTGNFTKNSYYKVNVLSSRNT